MDMTGSLLQASCKAFQLELGLSGMTLELPESMYSYITPTWLTQTWESLNPSIRRKHRLHITMTE